MKNVLVIVMFIAAQLFGQSVIYVGNIDGEIDLGMVPYVQRVINQAEANNADAVIFRINTFGGRVDAATQIKDAILNCTLPTIAYVDKRAISAGSLITLSCKNISMVKASSIGATTVVDGAGKKQSEKAQSYMRSEMRATAEINGRRTDIAEGMVDERVEIEGLVDSTQLVTLTFGEARNYGIADTIVTSQIEAAEAFGFEDPELKQIEGNWGEEVVRVLNHPFVTSLLMIVGFLGLLAEIKTPGWGVPGTAGIIALILFFGSGYIVNLVSMMEVLLFLVGLILLVVEIFVIPGFGVFGVLGLISLMVGIVLGLVGSFEIADFGDVSDAIVQVAISIIITSVLFYFLVKYLPKTRSFKAFVLEDEMKNSAGYSSYVNEKTHELVGKTGTAYTDLRPSGTAVIENVRYDVVTAGEYVKHGANIVVKEIQGSRIVVEEAV